MKLALVLLCSIVCVCVSAVPLIQRVRSFDPELLKHDYALSANDIISGSALPDSFDGRLSFPGCIHAVLDQG